jgi:hypothetical protein
MKTKQYRKMDPDSLVYNLRDAAEAYKNQEGLERAGAGWADKDQGWRRDDVLTILQVMKEKQIPVPTDIHINL